MSTIAERIRTLRGKAKQGDFAKALGINPNTLRSYENGRTSPNQEVLERMCAQFSVSPGWLLLGAGPMRADDFREIAHPPTKKDDAADLEVKTAPVVGLAVCGISGWYNPGPIALRAPIPGNYVGKGEIFAVIAIGYSMQPEGIRQGYVVFCDPGIAPVKDDAVFIETKDSTASIKKYIKKDSQWIYLQGWLDPNAFNEQKPYNEKIALEAVERIAPVINVQRKP